MERGGKWLGYVLAGYLALAGCEGPRLDTPRDAEYRVVKVIDGDTIEVMGGRRVRYIGIDAPETMRRAGSGWVFDPEPYGMAAKDRNREMVMGKNVRLEFDTEKRDRYNRWLAYVHAGDSMVNLELVREGLASVYTFPPNIRYYRDLLEAQEHARRDKRGLWAGLENILPEEADENTGRFCAVRGMVSGVRFSRGRIALYISSRAGGRLRAVIYARNIPLFAGEGIDPEKHYEGKFVEIFGKIEDRGGPEMVIDNPSQIKVLNGESHGIL